MFGFLASIMILVFFVLVAVIAIKLYSRKGNRVMNVIDGKADRAVEDFEKSDPDAVYRTAINEKRKEIGDLNGSIRELKGVELEKNEAIDSLQKKKEELGRLIKQAVKDQDVETGTMLIEEDKKIDAEVNELRIERDTFKNESRETIAALEDSKKELKELEDNQGKANAMLKSAKIMDKITARKQGVTGNDDAVGRALVNAKTAINAAKASRATANEIRENSIDYKMEKLHDRADKSSAADEFAKMVADQNKPAEG